MRQISGRDIALSNAQTIALTGCSFALCMVKEKDGSFDVCTYCKSEIIKWLLRSIGERKVAREETMQM